MHLSPPLVLRTGQRLVIDVEETRVLVRVESGDPDELRATLFEFMIPAGSEWVMSEFGDPMVLAPTHVVDSDPDESTL